MKKINLFAGAAIIALGFSSCKDENEKVAEKSFDSYEKYVDSVSNVTVDEAKTNWQTIEADYNAKTAEAEAALANMKDQAAAQERLDKSKAKYAELKAKFAPLAKALAENEDKIVAELAAVQGKAADIGGYYAVDQVKVDAVMRPSATLNAILAAV